MGRKQKYCTELVIISLGVGLLIWGEARDCLLCPILGMAVLAGCLVLEHFWFRCPNCKRYPPRKKSYFGRISCPYCGQEIER